MKKKVGEEAARHWINGMRSIASNVPISPFHLAAADDMESLLEEVLMYRAKSDGVSLTSMSHPVSLGKPSKHKISKKSLETMALETEWVGLTDEEASDLIQKWSGELVFEVTQALKEKNGN